MLLSLWLALRPIRHAFSVSCLACLWWCLACCTLLSLNNSCQCMVFLHYIVRQQLQGIDIAVVICAGARAGSALQPAHRSDDLDQARAPTRPPLSGLRGNSQSQLPTAEQSDWPSALLQTRSDMTMYTNHVHLTPGSDDAHMLHDVHHDLSSPCSHSSQGSRSSLASVATAPPGFSQYRNGIPTR